MVPACHVAAAASPLGTPPSPTGLDMRPAPAAASSARPRPTWRPARLLRTSLALLPGLLPGPGNLSFPSPRQSLLHTQSRPIPAQPVLCLPDPRPRSVLTGQRPHLPGPGRFRSRRRGPAWRAPGRVRPGPPWAFAPSLMPRTASGSLGTAACREALGSLLFSGACVSQTWCCSMPGPSRGPAHQRQLATGCPGP